MLKAQKIEEIIYKLYQYIIINIKKEFELHQIFIYFFTIIIISKIINPVIEDGLFQHYLVNWLKFLVSD